MIAFTVKSRNASEMSVLSTRQAWALSTTGMAFKEAPVLSKVGHSIRGLIQRKLPG
jgi:hypothetical protein